MAFKMRSGNGPLAFKNMGSSPAKQMMDEKEQTFSGKKDMDATAKANEAKARAQAIKEKNAAEAKIAKEKNDAANKSAADKAAKDKEAKASRGWREKKEANKAEKKENRGTRGDFKKGNKEEIAELKAAGATKEEINAAKKVNKQEQKDLKQSHRDDSKANKKDYKSGDDYKAHKAEQKQKFSDAVGELSDRVDPDNRGLYAKSKAAKTYRADKNIQNEKDRVNTARTQQLIDATNKAGTEEEKVSSTKSEAVNNDGSAAVNPKAKSSAEKVAEAKNTK